MNTPTINSFDSWTRLREVWLGDVYPVEWYEDLDPEIRDVFQTITEWTKEDLNKIESKLINDFGITVQRPRYHRIEDYIDPRFDDIKVLIKPEITPRDYYVVIGNNFYVANGRHHNPSWRHALDHYRTDNRIQIINHKLKITFSGAFTVRVGRDIFVDNVTSENSDPELSCSRRQYFDDHVVPMFPDYRMHYLDNGGHIDACFAVLRPGQLIANRYFEDYDRTFPGWQRIMLSDPTFHNHQRYKDGFSYNGKFWLPADRVHKTLAHKQVAAFNDHVVKYAMDWVGNYSETYFEVNCLVIDEKNVMFLGENEPVFRYLETLGITAHSMPFRCRTFWDGGMHCLTLDIRRDGGMAEYL